MQHEVPFRFNQALDASGLTSLDSALRSANDAILDCKRSGKRAERKKLFHGEARRALTALADALGYERSDFDLRSNQGDIASSGEVTLHSDEAYIQVSCDCRGGRVLFRRCRIADRRTTRAR